MLFCLSASLFHIRHRIYNTFIAPGAKLELPGITTAEQVREDMDAVHWSILSARDAIKILSETERQVLSVLVGSHCAQVVGCMLLKKTCRQLSWMPFCVPSMCKSGNKQNEYLPCGCTDLTFHSCFSSTDHTKNRIRVVIIGGGFTVSSSVQSLGWQQQLTKGFFAIRVSRWLQFLILCLFSTSPLLTPKVQYVHA